MFSNLITNWKTTVVGLGLLIVAVGHSLQAGSIDVNGFMAALAGLGLMGASDSKGA
jgi:hypothetical protein